MAKLTTLQKLAPAGGKGKIRNITTALQVGISGAGFSLVGNTIDATLFGGFLNRFGFNIPFLNIRMNAIDIGNYLAHNGGNVIPKSTRPLVALGAAKFTQGALTISGISGQRATGGVGGI